MTRGQFQHGISPTLLVGGLNADHAERSKTLARLGHCRANDPPLNRGKFHFFWTTLLHVRLGCPKLSLTLTSNWLNISTFFTRKGNQIQEQAGFSVALSGYTLVVVKNSKRLSNGIQTGHANIYPTTCYADYMEYCSRFHWTLCSRTLVVTGSYSSPQLRLLFAHWGDFDLVLF